MYDVENYMKSLEGALKASFADRLLYVGLQGSYLRGEATESSDLDTVVVLEGLTVEDVAAYKSVVDSLPNPEKACGFICGRQELAKWNPLEVCNFIHGTKDYYGKLSDFLPAYTQSDVVSFIKLSVGNLYHALCHGYIHSDPERNKKNLQGLYKQVFFVLQTLYYIRRGVFYPTRAALAEHLDERDLTVLQMGEQYAPEAFDRAFELLLIWCQSVLAEL